ncbi:MAG TPA: GAF domain-containing protein [Rhizobacter sp.]|nr:GAF domain-containing protein [Rhizobacter sp.]
MNTLIKAIEVWLPTADRTLLEFGGGLFGAATGFGASSRAMCFGRGEGLPGRAWFDGRPIVLKQFEGSYFRRAEAAREAGYSCAIAVPVFVGEQLNAVVVFFCGGNDAEANLHDGAVELWRNNARVTSDMTLVDGYYGGDAAESFEPLTRDTYLPRGSGLPGMAWQKGAAVLIDDLGQTTKFMRADSAAEAGINRGLAVPCSSSTSDAYVLALLSTTQTPIAKRIECWAPDDSRHGLQRVFGFCETEGALRASEGGTVLAGAIGKAFASGVPVINEHAATEPGGVGSAAKAAGLVSLAALPVVSDGAVSEVVALYF